MIPALILLLSHPLPSAVGDVPEAAEYTLLYDLQIPVDGGFADAVPWAENNAATIGLYDRIAWYVELQKPGQAAEWVWVSARAFAHDPTRIGVPTAGSGAHYQHGLVDMTVATSVPDKITADSNIQTGRIEFWPNNYQTGNSAGVLGASETTYDFGDKPIAPLAGYGSMQIHDTATGTTLFAWNRFGPAAATDLGIGNAPDGHPDWTFHQNAAEYSVRTLQVFVREDSAPPVPQAAGYELIYLLDLPNTLTAFHQTGVPYAVDLAATVPHAKRVAYYMELEQAGGQARWVWASMDPFTDDTSKLGVPVFSAEAVFQTEVTGLEVASNVFEVTTGVIGDGNIELWPHNYTTTNQVGVPGASDDAYDLGDQPVDPAAGYGSMQVHDTKNGVTVLAYNAWGSAGRVGDVGIGNSDTGEPDWTFAENAATYDLKTLSVWVVKGAPPVLAVTAPEPRSVMQRNQYDFGLVQVSGTHDGSADTIEARGVPREGFGGKETAWKAADLTADGFSLALKLTGGWYDVQVRALAASEVLETRTRPRVGVGEIFVTAGQSNSANHGLPVQKAVDERVLAHDLKTKWRPAHDPQPIATGSGGTPWPLLGDLLAAEYGVPIGFVSVGWGGTSVSQWKPDAANTKYTRLKDAVTFLGPAGFRAVLWHQGESDNAGGMAAATYQSLLEEVIAQSRADAGFDVPWGVARVSFLPAPGTSEAIVGAQNAVIAADDLVFEGPETDDLIGPQWRHDTVHFNGPGLAEHAKRWAEVIPAPQLLEDPNPDPEPEPDPEPSPDVATGAEPGPEAAPPVEPAVEPTPEQDPITETEPGPVAEAAVAEPSPQPTEDGAPGTAPSPPESGGCSTANNDRPSALPYSLCLVLLLLSCRRRSWQH